MYAIRFTLSLGLLLVALSGCQRDAAPIIDGAFVGRVSGSNAFIAIVRLDDGIIAYVCDGNSYANWIRGDVQERTVRLTSGNARLEATFADGGVTGTYVSREGTTHTFKAEPAEGHAGLYRAKQVIDGLSYIGGWIILPNGMQRGSIKQDDRLITGPEIHLDPAHPFLDVAGGTLEARRVIPSFAD